jgi:NADPH-dependent curcumin reductase CurA
VRKALRRHAPDGIDVYFDNVGGEILDAALTRLAMHARVVVCGAISQYNNATPVKGPSNYLSLLVNRARMEGIVVFDYAKRYPQAGQDIAAWIGTGQLKVKEHVVSGTVDDFPETLQMLFRGENVGKLVLELA